MHILKAGGLVLVAVLVLLGSLPRVQAQDEVAEYVGHNTCKICHDSPATGAQWTKWSEGPHANALKRLETDAAKAVAEQLGMTTPPHESPDCLQCHVTGYDPAEEKLPARLQLVDAVQCESCHGPNSLHVKDGQFLRFNPGRADEIDIRRHLKDITADTCRQCHNPESPTWDPTRYTLPDGTTVGFDYEQASAKIDHSNPQKEDAE